MALADGRGSVLSAIRGKVPSMRIQRRSGQCPQINLRSNVSFQGVVNPHVYVDGTRSTDTCILEALRIEDVDTVEVYPMGFTKRPVDMFQYMIGNTDWSAPYSHNIKMIRTEGPTYLVVPFDFDFPGAVNARYATPDPSRRIRNVRDRVYRGFCRDGFDYSALVDLFNERRDSITALVSDFETLAEDEREEMLKYYDEFYQTINNEGRMRREIAQACRRVGA